MFSQPATQFCSCREIARYPNASTSPGTASGSIAIASTACLANFGRSARTISQATIRPMMMSRMTELLAKTTLFCTLGQHQFVRERGLRVRHCENPWNTPFDTTCQCPKHS